MHMRWLILLCLLLSASVALAQDGEWTVESVNRLSLSNSVGARILPSWDATWLVYDTGIRLNGHIDRYLTLSTVEPGDEPRYFDKPEDLPRGMDADPGSYQIPFALSPDNSRVAVVSQPLGTLNDTDLWLFDVASESWTNLADDGYVGALGGEGVTPAPGTIVDTQPAWSPDGTRLAVERSVVDEAGTVGDARIAILDAATGEARDLIAVPGVAEPGATTSIAWSPDGAMLAFTVLHRQPDAENDGLWIADVETGEAELLGSFENVAGLFRESVVDIPVTSIGPVMWSPDGGRLMVWAGDTTATPIVVAPLVVDLETGEAMAVPLPAHPNDTPERRSLRPLQAAWSPDGESVLLFTFGFHPDEDRTSLDAADANVRGAVRIVDLDTGESQLLGYLPFGPATPLYYAAWGAAGDVIANGYHLVVRSN